MTFKQYRLEKKEVPLSYRQIAEFTEREGWHFAAFNDQPYRATFNINQATVILQVDNAHLGGPHKAVEEAKSKLEELMGKSLKEF